MNFEEKLLASTRYSPKPLSWVDWLGNSVGVSTGVTATEFSREDIDLVIRGKKLGDPAMLRFRDPACFRAGEVHEHYAQWQEIVGDRPSTEQQQSQFLNTFNLLLEVLKGNITVLIVHPRNILKTICHVSL